MNIKLFLKLLLWVIKMGTSQGDICEIRHRNLLSEPYADDLLLECFGTADISSIDTLRLLKRYYIRDSMYLLSRAFQSWTRR
jgi:hypothetical protein